LRRAVTDPTMPPESKAALASSVFASHLDASATKLVASSTTTRWGRSGDLADVLGQLGVMAIVKAADKAGEGDRVEGELFTFGRAVTENHDLRDALSDPARTVADKQVLIESLLGDKAASATVRLARESVKGTYRTVTGAIDEYTRAAASARNRLVATVRVARPLGEEQATRLASALGGESKRPVHLNMIVDPAVVGGIHVEIGDHVVDGSISSRLDDARRRVAG
jgi:F-type H+-transporting ATPase subunit delta